MSRLHRVCLILELVLLVFPWILGATLVALTSLFGQFKVLLLIAVPIACLIAGFLLIVHTLQDLPVSKIVWVLSSLGAIGVIAAVLYQLIVGITALNNPVSLLVTTFLFCTHALGTLFALSVPTLEKYRVRNIL